MKQFACGALLAVLRVGAEPAPATTVYVEGTFPETTTIDRPAPSPTTSFDFVYMYEETGCTGFCNTPLNRVGEGSTCTCDESCTDGRDKYGTCCDYTLVCLNNDDVTDAKTTTTGLDVSPTTQSASTAAGSTAAECPATCSGITCDRATEMHGISCDVLEFAPYNCDCGGCLCPDPVKITSAVGSTLPDSTLPVTVPSTVAPTTTTTTTTPVASIAIVSTSEAPTTTTTEDKCKPTCFGLSCDDWVPFGGLNINTRCSFLEREHGCDCTDCDCDDAAYTTDAESTIDTTETPTTTTTTTELQDLNYGIDTSVIGGGYANTAIGKYSAVGGGRANAETQEYDTIIGGVRNSLRSNYATVGGGYQNTVLGRFASIPGGRLNSAAGRQTVLLGSRASTAGKNVDHVFIMNFLSEESSPLPASVETENTILLQANDIYINDVDILSNLGIARQLGDREREIDQAASRIGELRTTLAAKLHELEHISA